MSNRLPNDLINHLKADPAFNYEAFIAIHEKEQKTTSIRFNPLKNSPLEHFDIAKEIPWCEEGYMLKSRPLFTLDPFFHAGCYYSQEASSMFLDYAIRTLGLNNEPIKALDLCASPGGKSTLLNSVLHPKSLLLANEIIKSRALVLKENLIKWGNANVVVSSNDPSAFSKLPGYFDLMVVDAPCSGSGMFHKDHNAIDEWSLANVKLCKERQQRILSSSLAALKTDGYLFYSTCSYSRDENEDMLDWIIEEHGFESIGLPISDDWRIDTTTSTKQQAKGYRFYPHQVDGEGFFFTVLRKKKEQSTFSTKRIKIEFNMVSNSILEKWMDMDGLFAFDRQGIVHVFPKMYELDLQAIKNVLYLKNAGTAVGKIVGKDLVPNHDLALSNLIKKDIQSIELDLENAQNFLRKENISPELNVDKLVGWVLIRFQGVNLGWIKAMPNRINNYYPKEVRIANL